MIPKIATSLSLGFRVLRGRELSLTNQPLLFSDP